MPVTAQQVRVARTVTLSDGECFQFARIEPRTAAHLSQLAEQQQDDRAYLADALSTLLDSPRLSIQELIAWSDARLRELAVGYLNLPANKGRRAEGASVSVDTLPACRQVLEESINSDIQRLKASFEQLTESLAKNAWKFGLATPPITTPFLEAIQRSPLLQLDQIAKAQAAIFQQLNGGLTTQLQQSVNRLIEQQTRLSQSLQQLVDPALQIGQILKQLDFSWSVSVLDSWAVIQRSGIFETLAQVRADRRAALLLEADLEFLNDLVDEAIDEVIDDAAFTHPHQQRTYVGRRLRDVTASNEFWQQLEHALASSTRAHRRLTILRAAHRAHHARQYELSVPTLYAQVEGLLADCLCESGHIRWSRKRRHWIIIDPQTGKDRMVRKKGQLQPETVRGIDRLTDIAKGRNSVSATRTVVQLKTDVASMRNQVMHGTKTNYATARNSSRLLIIARILVLQLRQLEKP